jgi:hypothetical protein
MIRQISLILLSLTSVALAETSVITKQGQTIPVEVLSVAGQIATVTRNNVKTTFRLDQLTDASQTYVITVAKTKNAYSPFPPLRAQVTVGTKSRPNERTYYKKDMEIDPQVKLSAVSALDPVPEIEAIMLIITQDTRAKFAQHIDRFVIQSTETVKVPAAKDGKMRDIDFAKCMVSFDAWRDATNVGGFTYKYYLFALRDPETKKIIDFQTNHPQLPAFVATHPDKKDELINLAEGKVFPAEFK